MNIAVVEDTHHRTAFVDTGTTLTLPLFFLEGVCIKFTLTLCQYIIGKHNFLVLLSCHLSF